MSHELLNKAWSTVVSIDFNATGDTVFVTPNAAVPIDVYRWGFVPYVNVDVAADNFIVALDFRPTAGSDAGRVELQRMTFTPAQDLVANTTYYADLILPVAQAVGEDALEPSFPGIPRSLINVGPAGPHRPGPAGQYVFERVDASGNAGTGTIFLEFVQHNFPGTQIAGTVNKTP